MQYIYIQVIHVIAKKELNKAQAMDIPFKNVKKFERSVKKKIHKMNTLKCDKIITRSRYERMVSCGANLS